MKTVKQTVILSVRSSLSTTIQEFYHFRYVLSMLTLRDIKLRYKQTFLGVVWVVLQPLSTAGLFGAIFGKGLGMPFEGDSYLLFTFAALIPWMVFSHAIERGSQSILNDTRLITKVYFPRIFIPLSATLGVTVDYLVTVATFLILCIPQFPSVGDLLIGLPLATLHLLLLCSALNTLIAALIVYVRDLKHIVPFLIQMTMIASPIVYPTSLIPARFVWLYQLNPLVGIVELYRSLLLGRPFPTTAWALSVGVTLILLASSFSLFRKLEPNFADVI